jgi:hypothetical protein
MNIALAISIVLLAIFALITVAYCCCLVRFLVKGTNFSVIPFLGGILGGAGFLLAPNPALRHLWWLPLILDYGSLPSLAWALLVLVRKHLNPMEH